MSFFQQRIDIFLLFFVFFATLTSYSLHWFLTFSEKRTPRMTWTQANKKMLLYLFLFALLNTLIGFFYVIHLWKIICTLAFFTFCYTAPKIPHSFFAALRGLAIAKTLYLALVWLGVTVFLPLQKTTIPITNEVLLFASNRFCILLSVCMLFDFRDRNEDYGIKNLITYFDERELLTSMWITFVFFLITSLFWFKTLSFSAWCLFILPMCLQLSTIHISKKTSNDYWFYVYIDGLMLVSGISLSFNIMQ
jgi:hypothetical protein